MLNVKIAQFNYPESKDLLRDISFSLEQGVHLAILGESGGGKSTLLHLIYGLLELKQGAITYNDQAVLGPSKQLVPGAPYMKLVAQEANVMPYTTVAENITEFLPRLDLAKDLQRATDLMKLVGLETYAKTKVKTLSGGQKQRVAIAKALAKEPKILLLDEPFSHIDEFRKSRLRRGLYAHLKSKNISCITATHDANEALGFADYVLVLEQGKVSFYGSPESWYHSVSSAYQAGFFGEITELSLANGDIQYVFPHQLSLSDSPTQIQVNIVQSYFKGSHYLIQATRNSKLVFFNHSSAIQPGTTHYLKQQ